jgi:hypothetical protein
MSFTYDPTTPIGQLRMAIADTNISTPIWMDEELSVWLTTAQNVIFLAAAYVLEAESTDQARIAERRDIGDWGSTRGEIYNALMKRAERMRNLAPVLPQVIAPLPTATLDDNQGNTGTMDLFYAGPTI